MQSQQIFAVGESMAKQFGNHLGWVVHHSRASCTSICQDYDRAKEKIQKASKKRKKKKKKAKPVPPAALTVSNAPA